MGPPLPRIPVRDARSGEGWAENISASSIHSPELGTALSPGEERAVCPHRPCSSEDRAGCPQTAWTNHRHGALTRKATHTAAPHGSGNRIHDGTKSKRVRDRLEGLGDFWPDRHRPSWSSSTYPVVSPGVGRPRASPVDRVALREKAARGAPGISGVATSEVGSVVCSEWVRCSATMGRGVQRLRRPQGASALLLRDTLTPKIRLSRGTALVR